MKTDLDKLRDALLLLEQLQALIDDTSLEDFRRMSIDLDIQDMTGSLSRELAELELEKLAVFTGAFLA